jgi:hypothetical protein
VLTSVATILHDLAGLCMGTAADSAHIPSYEIGSRYFQETHPESIFRECRHYCKLVSQAEQMPGVLEIAIQTALVKRLTAPNGVYQMWRCPASDNLRYLPEEFVESDRLMDELLRSHIERTPQVIRVR